jgi:glycosyltransferase involved in cell wall biosynthesis
VSNARGVKSGYGVQTDLFTPRLKRAGYELGIFAYAGYEGNLQLDADGIITYPRLFDGFGNDVIAAHVAHHKADVVFGLFDPHVIDPAIYSGFNWAHWSPVDSDPPLPLNIDRLRAARWVVAMSKHGQEVLRRFGLNAEYVPHGIDTKIFKPIDRKLARERLAEHLKVKLDGRFLVVMNAANQSKPSRKGFAQAFKAFKIFSDKVKASKLSESGLGKPCLYIHSEMKGYEGENLALSLKSMGIDLDDVIFPNQYYYMMGILNGVYLNDVYNSGDVFLHLAHGEGFGVPSVEAQAAGCPVIMTDFTAMSELNFGGWKVCGERYQHHEGTERMLPNVEQAACYLWEAYNQPETQRLAGRAKAHQGAQPYDVETVMSDYMLPLFSKMKMELAQEKDRQQSFVHLKAHKQETPPISVLMPIYNLEGYGVERFKERLFKTLNHTHLEICMCDDASTDSTPQILEELASQNPNIRITANAKRMGASEALNTAATIARGKYFIFGSARSYYVNLPLLAKTLDEEPEIGFVYGETQYSGALNFRNCPDEYKQEEFINFFPSLLGYMYRREAFDLGCRYIPYMTLDDGRVVCVGERDFIMQLIFRHGWKGKSLPILVLNYWMDESGQQTHLLKDYKAQMVEIYNQRWGEFGTKVEGL